MLEDEAPPLDLTALPPVYVSTTHLNDAASHALEDRLTDCRAQLTYDIHEAKIVLTKAGRKRRAQFDLQAKGVWTEELPFPATIEDPDSVLRPAKRQRPNVDDASSKPDSDADTQSEHSQTLTDHHAESADLFRWADESDVIAAVMIDWFDKSVESGHILNIAEFLVFFGRVVPDPSKNSAAPAAPTESKTATAAQRTKFDLPLTPSSRASPGQSKTGRHRFGGIDHPSTQSFAHGASNSKPPQLLLQTTSEHDGGVSSDLPDMPEWVKQGISYSCQRITPAESENSEFIALLKDIKLARLLTNDEIGVRAYSTSIAAICAYPYKIADPREILALPGCDAKVANLFVEYTNTGKLQAAQDARDDAEIMVLKVFYDIWGVGALTAREFYYDRGWRDLDDVVEFGWSTLLRVQQIGVKFYDEFLSPIPRDEVELIASIIHRHAVKVRDQGIQSLLVGGYRRGKQQCGDVDIIVSHPDEAQTLNIINDIVSSLETEEFITHTLLLSLTTSNRDQQALPYRQGGSGGGFDSLDKALVVWQDPEWPTKASDLLKDTKAKNPNIHRRVDIIIAPWRAVGCAVAGWSGGTTFQRDLRRYVKSTRGWKFDSSGVRDRHTGRVVDVEGYDQPDSREGRAKTMVEAEKRVFQALGLEFREPWERCTG